MIKEKFIDYFYPKNTGKHSIPYKKHPPDHERLIFFSRPNETFAVGYSPNEFKDLTGVIYLSHLEFENLQTLQRIYKQCEKSTLSQSTKWLSTLYAREIESGFVNDLIIRWIDDTVGYGVFAKRDIRKGEFIGEYTGVAKRCFFFYSNVNEYCFHYPIYNLLINVHTIDPQYKGNETRFINHSNQPNCASFVYYHDHLLHIGIRAIKAIPKSEELTFDYGKDWWGDRAIASRD